MKSVLISIRPKWVEKIASGEKTIEVRKTVPQEVPFKCYIYETKGETETPWIDEDGHFIYKGRGQVIGEFICDKIDKYTFSHYEAEYRVTHVEQNAMCLNQPELIHYGKGKTLYGWHISELKIYDKPKELSEFVKAYPIKCGKGYESIDCTGCGSEFTCAKRFITRPPQSWQYVEDLGYVEEQCKKIVDQLEAEK